MLMLSIMIGSSAYSQSNSIDFSYPPLIAGSSWANIFQRLYKNGDYESMIKLTSKESIEKYSADTIRIFYQTMDFGYMLKLKSWTMDSNYYHLNYSATINATETIIRLKLTNTQGDTAKIVLPADFRKQKYFLYR